MTPRAPKPSGSPGSGTRTPTRRRHGRGAAVAIGALALVAAIACAPIFDGNALTVDSVDGTYVKISWTAATASDDHPVSRYQVEVDGYVITSTVPANSTTCVLTGLAPSKTYSVKVTAYNSADEWSGDISGDNAALGFAGGSVTTGARGISGGPKGCVSPIDSDGDRLPNAVETGTGTFAGSGSTGTKANQADTDNDGIKDGDEVLGTTANLNLPAMGTRPGKQDILLEFDWFTDTRCGSLHSHRPTAAAIARAKTAFAGAPTVQFNGTTGINLISDYGQGGAFTGGNYIADADGQVDGYVDDAQFLAFKGANFAANRNGYFHYVLNPHNYGDSSNGSSGQAEINGDDLMVSLGCYGTDEIQGNTIMHELGHNLALRHGGFENTNYKPNYSSVMNYMYQFNGVDTDCDASSDHVLTYSKGPNATLNENALSEAAGVCGGVALDWNGDGYLTPGTVAVDLNGDGAKTSLADNNDWNQLNLHGIADGDGASPTDRVTPEIVTEQSFPADQPVTTR